MQYAEVKRDLFTQTDGFTLVQCVSADFALSKGIAVDFNKRFDMKRRLKNARPDYLNEWKANGKKFDCILCGGVMNLVTKERFYSKPTYDSMRGALETMRSKCNEMNIQKLAMPKIGCGLDKLKWEKVSEMIMDIFEDTDIEILVCFIE